MPDHPEHHQAIDTTMRMAVLADHRRWEDLAGVFADEVRVDAGPGRECVGHDNTRPGSRYK